MVYFHGVATYPLYIQVTFDRRSIFFKSCFFELFEKAQFQWFFKGKKKSEVMNYVIEREQALIEFVIDKDIDEFSLDRFKEFYSFYGQDFCEGMKQEFIDYVFTFFHDKGMPAFANIIKEGAKFENIEDVVRDMKMALDKSIYIELIENSFHYGPPYLPLISYQAQSRNKSVISLSVMDWTKGKFKHDVFDYFTKTYPSVSFAQMEVQIEKWLRRLENEKVSRK